MVRRAAEMRIKYDAKRGTELGQEMDLDVNGSHGWGDNMETDGGDHGAELTKLENKMLSYGQALQAEYAKDPRKEISKSLNEIWASVAYRNPLKEPQVSHLLDGKGRVTVAEELNSAILCRFFLLFVHTFEIPSNIEPFSIAGEVITGIAGNALCADQRAAGRATKGWRPRSICLATGCSR